MNNIVLDLTAMFPTANKNLEKAWPDPVKMTYAQREILKGKPQFFAWYKMIYEYMQTNKTMGSKNLEVGSGSSFLYEFIPELIRSNVIHIKFNDLTCNAYHMPFRDNVLDNIILIDVLHHFDKPLDFFSEAQRILRKNGRILISDPYISPFSYFIWKYIHPERCIMNRIGYEFDLLRHNPIFSANSASLTLLFEKNNSCFRRLFPNLEVARKDYHTTMHYWLAGGYNFPSFIPYSRLNFLKQIEKSLLPLGRFLASFLFVVVEKVK